MASKVTNRRLDLERESPANIPDLDYCTKEQLQEFMDRKGMTDTERAALRFPEKPPYYLTASRLLDSIAFQLFLRRKRQKTWEEPVQIREVERMYQRLPLYAQWRRKYGINVRALVQPGKVLKLRRKPGRKKS